MPMNQNSGTTNASKLFWWQKLTLKRTYKPTNNTRAITQNWRNLSPDEPPLPFLNSSNNKAISVSANPVPSIKFSEANNHGSELAPISKNHHERPRTYPTAPSSCRDLYTIPEHSEINTTASNSSAHSSVIPTTLPNTMEEESTSSSSQPLAQLNLIRDEDLFVPPLSTISPNTSLSSSSVALTSTISTQAPSKRNHSHSTIAEKEEQAEKSTQDFVPITDWPSSIDTTKEPQFKGELEGNEIECKIVFCNMLASAYKYHSYFYHQQPKEMHLIFDDMDNIGGIKFILPNGHREDYLQFGGTPQYIPPELSLSAIYNNELADVWALGISLYRMLVGEYPFVEDQSHLALFRKMLQSDFRIPDTLSEDAKDLLRRMLAPEGTRASFDLIMFHPWIKSHFQPQRTMLHSTPSSAAKPVNQPKGKRKKKRKVVLQAIKKVIRIVFLGPYPPPKKNYYHHNNNQV